MATLDKFIKQAKLTNKRTGSSLHKSNSEPMERIEDLGKDCTVKKQLILISAWGTSVTAS